MTAVAHPGRPADGVTDLGARVLRVVVTPVAFRDPPLLNAVGVHEPWALRSVVELVTESGVAGLGESYGDLPHLQRLQRAAGQLVGLDAFDLPGLRRAVVASLAADDGVGGRGRDRHQCEHEQEDPAGRPSHGGRK